MAFPGGGNPTMGETMSTIRTIKLLALSALALVAIGAVSATSAQAGTFTAANYPATITGQNVGLHELTTELGVMECETKLHGEMEEDSGDLTMRPNFGTSCEVEGLEVHVKTNECHFLFHAGGTLAMDEVEGSMDVKCPEGAEIEFAITSMVTCHMAIPEQVGLGDVTYTDKTMARDVDVDLDLEGLQYELGLNCPVFGAFEGSYAGTTTLASDNEGVDAFTVD
jgi:hypothetical protein